MTEAVELTLGFLRRHPDAAASVLEALPPETAAGFLQQVPTRMAAPVWAAMLPVVAARCLILCPAEYASAVLAAMSPRSASGVLRRVAEPQAEALMERLPRRAAFAVKLLLRYPVTTIGAWMDPTAATVPAGETVLNAWIRLRRDAEALERYVYVIERGGQRLVGRVASVELLRAEGETVVDRLVEGVPAAIAARADLAAALAEPLWRDCDPLPVVARDGAFLGVAHHAVISHAEQSSDGAPSGPVFGETLMELAEAYWSGLARLIEGPFSHDAMPGGRTAGRKD